MASRRELTLRRATGSTPFFVKTLYDDDPTEQRLTGARPAASYAARGSA